MNMHMRWIIRALLCGAMVATSAVADTWPSRPIKLVVPTGPGAATDIIARLIADALSKKLERPMVVENKAGASGIPGHQAVAQADPDGHTLLFTNTSGMAINPVSFNDLPYNARKDFTAVALVASVAPQMLSVSMALPVRNAAEFVAYAKANRGKVSLAYDTTAGAAAFAAKLLNKRAALELIEVPYKAVGQLTQDVVSGRVLAMVSSIAVAEPIVQAGKVRRLAITSEQRFAGLPDLPPLNDVVPGVVMNGWFAIVAPAGTAQPIVVRLNREIGVYLNEPEIQKRLISFGVMTEGAGTPASTASFIAREQNLWDSLAKELNIERQ